MSDRMDRRLREVLHLVSFLCSKGSERPSIKEVAAALGCPPARARELITLATMSGKAPFGPDDMIEIHVDKNSRVELQLDQRLGQPVQFSRPEALALVIALKAVVTEGDLGPEAEGALDKLRSALIEQVKDGVEKLESRFAFEGDDAGVAERFEILRRGMDEGRAVDMSYYTAGRDAMSERRLRPYAMMNNLGQWYAIGRDSMRKEIRVFKVERIKEAALSDERFEIPASFKAERYRKKGKLLVGRRYREARVRFRDPAARVIREEWPPQLVEVCADGSVIGTLHFVAVEGLANWLLAHGGAAEVLEPDELRVAVVDRARAALAHYERGDVDADADVDEDGIPYL